MSTVEITQENFKTTISKPGIVVLDWWATWCGPCKAFAPVFEAASAVHTDIVFGKIDTDEQQELARAFRIRSIPTLMVFRDGIPVFAQPGALPKAALEEVIRKVSDLDMAEVKKKIEAAAKPKVATA
jgi:thioredoxin 1